MKKDILGVAVIGAGNMGRYHMTAITQAPEFELRVVCDRDAALAAKLAKEFSVSVCAQDYRETVKREDVDVVYVCVPAGLHAEVAIEAAAAGKHVFCEKPLALTPADGERMIRAAKEANVQLAMAFQHRFQKYVNTIRDLFQNGDLGRPVYYSIYSACSVRPNPAMNDANGNGGPLIDVLCHYVDIWRYVFNSDPIRVFASARTFAEGKAPVSSVKNLALDTGVVTIEFASGDVGCFQTSWGLPEGVDPVSFQHAMLPEALIEFEPFSTIRIRRNSGSPEEITDLQMEIQELQNAQANYFAAALRNGTPPRTTGEDGMIALKVSAAVLKSAQDGRAIDLKY